MNSQIMSIKNTSLEHTLSVIRRQVSDELFVNSFRVVVYNFTIADYMIWGQRCLS
jgi:hypothetical protein